MRFTTTAIVCALRSHGEHGAVVRLMTAEEGLQAAYVRGARGRRMRPVLMCGNVVQAALSARTDTQLPQATIELAQRQHEWVRCQQLIRRLDCRVVVTHDVSPSHEL